MVGEEAKARDRKTFNLFMSLFYLESSRSSSPSVNRKAIPVDLFSIAA